MALPCPQEFAGRVALVSGGSSGIGAHLVKTLAGLGCEVFFCGRRPEPGRATEDACGGHGHFIACDLADPAQARGFVEKVLAGTDGSIDYLVSSAAQDARVTFEDATAEGFDEFIASNLRPSILVCRAALPGLRKGFGKSVLILGTTNWMLGLAPFTLYAAAKSGLLGFTRALARELGPERIRVNMVSPGWIMTEKQLRLHVTAQDKQDLLRDQSLPFLLTEAQVTPPVLFLLSAGAEGITGQNLVVDGGKLMS